ncbi:hypothetical protein EANG_04503 [Escherichia coli FVEC1465]|nr:hypothetical protein EANG_04503 [Escherichia coli FVEC1465]
MLGCVHYISFLQINENASRVQAGVSGMKSGE